MAETLTVERNGYPVPVPARLIYRSHGAGAGMHLACGHDADGIVRGSGNLYHCPTCHAAEESIYTVQARKRHRKSGWGGIFRRLRRRLKASPDVELRDLVRDLADLVEEGESGGWGHGHRDANGWCPSSGEDCAQCERLDRIRAWVESHA